MKKLLRIAVVLCLAICLCATAFAAGSSQSGARVVGEGTSSTGTSVPLTVAESTQTPTAEEAAASIKSDDVKAEDLSVVWVQDISAEIPEGGSVTITFEVPGATADDTVFVLHYNGSTWETVAACKGNEVKATFTSLSPVALVLEKAPATTPGHTSPVTGEAPILLAAAVVALLAGTVAVAAVKKEM